MNQKSYYEVSKHAYATHGQRIGNSIIDGLNLGVLFFAIVYLNAKFGNASLWFWCKSLNWFEQWLYFGLIEVFYYLALELTFGTTIGKLVSRTMIVDEFGEKPPPQAYAIRSFARIIPFERFSFLTAFCRGWHDIISNTCVVDIETFNKEKETFYQNQKAKNGHN